VPGGLRRSRGKGGEKILGGARALPDRYF